MSPAFQVRRTSPDDSQSAELRFSGELNFRDGSRLQRQVKRLLGPSLRQVTFDLSNVESLDGGSTALLLDLRAQLDREGVETRIVVEREPVRRILELYEERARRTHVHEEPEEPGLFEQIGRVTEVVLVHLSELLGYLGDVLVEGRQALRDPRSVHWRDLGRIIGRTGFDALPIVSLLCFLVGLVTGFQAAVQLRQFGADIYVADLVGISVTRELGPLMTAILVAGRSGAAFAAELGTMQVSEEVDALGTMGLDRYRFLVFPRVLALVIAVPALTLVGDAMGILGGLVVAVAWLEITPAAFLTEMQLMVDLSDVFGGVLKSVFFGLSIGLVACQRGLATRGGAEGVGISTTSAVVMNLFFLIVIDAAFTVLYHVYDI